MKKTLISLISYCLLTGGVLAQYDPPERLWFKMVGEDDDYPWADKYTWIGDQNGDGCDELLVNHDPSFGRRRGYNRLELYFGGEDMDTIPDVIFGPYHEFEGVGTHICFIGNLTGNGSYNFAIKGTEWIGGGEDSTISRIYIFEGGEELDTIPDYSITLYNDYVGGGSIHVHELDRPCDINGDGYDDLIVKKWLSDENERSDILIFYGGEDFDTIPDFNLVNDNLGMWLGNIKILSSYDLNGDGCDELLFETYNYENNVRTFSLYIGGADMDTTPYFELTDDLYEEQNLYLNNVGMVSDVNGDGYDDWGLGFYARDDEEERTWIFFGGDSLQMDQPDLLLEPYGFHATRDQMIFGGDINNDDIGDIITSAGSPGSYGNARFFFGSHWIDDELDIIMTGRGIRQLYGMSVKQGVHADFNGDGINDIVYKCNSPHEPPRLHIYLGSEDWVVSVKEENNTSADYRIKVTANPNPFNSETQLMIDIPMPGEMNVQIYDVLGHLVSDFESGMQITGRHTLSWRPDGLSSGVYLARVTLHGSNGEYNLVCKLLYLQ